METIIRPLKKEDVETVVALESELICAVSKENVFQTIGSDRLFYFVLEEKNSNEILGFLQCSVLAPEAELFEIAINQNFQGKGLANKLMIFFFDFAKSHGCDTIFLEVSNINMKAKQLYQKHGFCEISRRKNYYGENQDAIIMKKSI